MNNVTFEVKIISSPSAYTTVIKWRGIPDPRRPNGKKPFYRRVVVKIPQMYRMGDVLVAHPDIIEKLRKQVQP